MQRIKETLKFDNFLKNHGDLFQAGLEAEAEAEKASSKSFEKLKSKLNA